MYLLTLVHIVIANCFGFFCVCVCEGVMEAFVMMLFLEHFVIAVVVSPHPRWVGRIHSDKNPLGIQ